MGQAKVMIVEDEVIAAMAAERMLKKLGYDVCGNVSSGEDALEVMDSDCPDFVLMDIRLDGKLDGIETSLKMREIRKIPVIFVTAYSDETTRQRAQAAQPLAFINKPLDMGLLRNALGGLPQ